MLEIQADQALAYRVAGHHLHRRTPDALAAVAACAVQEYPPGWAAVALHARTTGTVDGDAVVVVNAMRGAPHLVPVADRAVFTLALVPPDEGLKALIGSATAKEVADAGLSLRGALDIVADAARDGLADGPLGRDDFHQALRERLPEGLLPWCRGCKSHHVRPGLWRALGPLGVTVMPAKATYALADGADGDLDAARAELARRFLRCFGPATHTELAGWAQTSPAHAKQLFAAIGDELEEVRCAGARRWILAAEAERVQAPPAARGVRVLGGFDPYVGQPDRATFVPDPGVRKRLFPAVGRPGVVLADGVLAGLWRGRKKGERLDVELDWLPGAEPVDVAAELDVVARLRGCAGAHIAAA